MRWILLFVGVLALTVVLAYAASPLHSAWVLSEAVRDADHYTLERKVKWDSVRASLKDSVDTHPYLLKQATTAGSQVRPSLWQRVKSAMGATMLDRFIETYVSPEGLPLLAQAHSEKIAGASDSANAAQRLARLLTRVKRIRFESFTRAELVIADEQIPERRYAGVLEIEDSEWKLVSVRVTAVEDDGSLLARR
jgi:hypothetical protein